MSSATLDRADRVYEHISHLAQTIGARPSTGVGEQDAARYAAHILLHAGLKEVRLETFESPRSTYEPYRRVFAAALLGTLLYRLRPGRATALLGAALSGAAARGFWTEADLADNWTRRLLPRGGSQNVVGVVPAAEEKRQRVVIYGHLDSHRTPIFYSSALWLRLFSLLLGAAFVSLGLNALLYTARALERVRVDSISGRILAQLQRVASGMQVFSLALTIQADQTPYTAGANDNASGAALALALGECLAAAPLRHTEVWIMNTGCEEVGAYGIAALLDRHGAELRDALFLNFDMVGLGDPAFIPRQGLLRRREADRRLLGAARAVAAAHPELRAWEHEIDAFDDSYMVARRGFRGLTIDAEGPPGSPSAAEHKQWHRPGDTVDRLDRDTLGRVFDFAWQMLLYLEATAR